MPRVCPSCGKTDIGNSFINNFCMDCFSKHFKLVDAPAEIEISRCSVCSKVKTGVEWVREDKRVLSKIIEAHLRPQYPYSIASIELRGGRRNCFDALVNLRFTVNSSIVPIPLHLVLKFNQVQCLQCSREQGGYYDSIVQLRFLKEQDRQAEKLESKIKKLERILGEKGGYVRKIEEVETGFDIYTAGITPTMQASHALCRNVKHTRKLIGRKNGKDLYRHTFCLRF